MRLRALTWSVNESKIANKNVLWEDGDDVSRRRRRRVCGVPARCIAVPGVPRTILGTACHVAFIPFSVPRFLIRVQIATPTKRLSARSYLVQTLSPAIRLVLIRFSSFFLIRFQSSVPLISSDLFRWMSADTHSQTRKYTGRRKEQKHSHEFIWRSQVIFILRSLPSYRE